MRIVTSAQMKQIEENSLAYDLTFHRLMENAGSAAAAFIRRTFDVKGLNCMVFCAKGNNGGDGLVVARKLCENGANVVIVMLDGIPRSKEAAAMYQTVLMMDLPMVDFTQEPKKVTDFLTQTDIVVDAICGTGFTGLLRDNHRLACQAINKAVAAVISLDMPTGVECDTGAADPDAVRADFTIAFDSMKPAHAAPAAKEYVGTVETVDIGIPPEAHLWVSDTPDSLSIQTQPAESLSDGLAFEVDEDAVLQEQEPEFSFVTPEPEPAFTFEPVETELEPEEQPEPAPLSEPATQESQDIPAVRVIETPWVLQQLQVRPTHSHKGDFGKLLVVAGCQNYRGAAALATLGALRSGAGLVMLASTAEVCSTTAAHVLEATYLPLAASAAGGIDYEAAAPLLGAQLENCSAIVFGCGLGNTVHTARLLAYILERASCPLLIDADGINALAENIHVLHKASAPVILTPHPGEMARLCGVSTHEIGQDRQGFACRIAQEYGVTVILKGPSSLVASPDAAVLRNTTGNPGLAKGGSGDILSGIAGSLLAQGLPPVEACACAVHLHGLAADRCAARRSQYAMLPSELLEDLAQFLLENGR